MLDPFFSDRSIELNSQCPISGSALGFCRSRITTVLLMRFQQRGTKVITHHTGVRVCEHVCVCVLPNWPTWLLTHWPSYKYSYSHTILITVKGRVHIGGELYIIEKVIHLNTNLLISYWTWGVKKKFLEIESYSSANLYITNGTWFRTRNHLEEAACANMNALSGKVNTKFKPSAILPCTFSTSSADGDDETSAGQSVCRLVQAHRTMILPSIGWQWALQVLSSYHVPPLLHLLLYLSVTALDGSAGGFFLLKPSFSLVNSHEPACLTARRSP